MPPERLLLREDFHVSAISSLHFFEYGSDFIFKSAYHDSFTLLYVTRGACEIVSGPKSSPVVLEEGQLYIQAPRQQYSFRASSPGHPTLFSCGFYCDSSRMALLTNRSFRTRKQEQKLLSLLASEGRANFSPDISGDSSYSLVRKFNRPFGGEQLVRLYLEMLMIDLVRQVADSEPKALQSPALSSLSQTDAILLQRITDYYSSHIAEHITVEQLCRQFSIGRSHLQRIFRQETGLGAIEYLCQMRVSAAKKMIRENQKNMTEIAGALGYTSIHYFSKQFKKITGMAPSKYARAIHTATSDPIYQQIDLDTMDFHMDNTFLS